MLPCDRSQSEAPYGCVSRVFFTSRLQRKHILMWEAVKEKENEREEISK